MVRRKLIFKELGQVSSPVCVVMFLSFSVFNPCKCHRTCSQPLSWARLRTSESFTYSFCIFKVSPSSKSMDQIQIWPISLPRVLKLASSVEQTTFTRTRSGSLILFDDWKQQSCVIDSIPRGHNPSLLRYVNIFTKRLGWEKSRKLISRPFVETFRMSSLGYKLSVYLGSCSISFVAGAISRYKDAIQLSTHAFLPRAVESYQKASPKTSGLFHSI